MLARIALTPGTLDSRRYSSEVSLNLCVGCLDDLCRNEGLFLDMRAGNWKRFAEAYGGAAKRFLVFASREGRLLLTAPELTDEPSEEEHWLWEAQAVDAHAPCKIIVTDPSLAKDYNDNPKIICIEALNSCEWWRSRSPSKTVKRETAEYMEVLGTVLKNSKSLIFIDPHVDPLKENYAEFPSLLLASAARVDAPAPLIEIHRASWFKQDGKKQVKSRAAWRADFMTWDEQLVRAGLKVEVFLWEDVHNRYLLSDMIGINVPNGFDIEPGKSDTFARLGRQQRDQLQLEYDRGNPLHGFAGSFEIGLTDPD